MPNRREFIKWSFATAVTAVAARQAILQASPQDLARQPDAPGVSAFTGGPGGSDDPLRHARLHALSDALDHSGNLPFSRIDPGVAAGGDYELPASPDSKFIAARGLQSGFYVRGAGAVLRTMMRLSTLGAIDNLIELGDSALDMSLLATAIRNNSTPWRDFLLQDSSLVTAASYGKLRRVASDPLGSIQFASAQTPSAWRNLFSWISVDGGTAESVSSQINLFSDPSSMIIVTPDGFGGYTWTHGSGALPDAHHAQSHTLTSHSTRAHSELTSIGAGDHHAQAHDHTAGDGSGVLTNDEHDGFEELAEIVAPATPAANKLRLYAKDSAGVSKLFYKQDDGVEIGPLAAGGGAGEANTISFMVYFSKTKTNIGTAYVDIYNTLEPDELFNVINFDNFADFRIVFIWDYVGVGTQQVRWVDRANNANVLWESLTFTADQDGTDSGWIVLPAWATGEKQVEWQGKSTTGTDDPIAKGYILLLR